MFQSFSCGGIILVFGFGELDNIAQLDLLSLLVKKAKLDTLGAVFDEIEIFWLEIHFVCFHGYIITRPEIPIL